MANALPVTVRDLVTVTEFDSFMRPPGQPLLVAGWMGKWKACSDWNFEFFKERYGQDRVSLTYVFNDPEISFQVKLAHFIDYILQPEGSSLDTLAKTMGLSRPLYTYSYKPFQEHPELMEDFFLPPFVSDWFSHFSASFRDLHFPRRQGWLLIGREGSISDLHVDAYHTIAWLAQVRGRKKCLLFSPEDSAYLYEGRVNPLDPDLEQFPLFAKATAYECSLEPGTMLFLPPDWWHYVITLENSITLSYNIVNHINFGPYLKRAYGKRLPDWLSRLPGLA